MRGGFWSSGTAPGIACIVVAMMMLSLQDSLVKWLSTAYALHQIVLSRSVIALALTLIVLIATARLGHLRTRRWSLHLTRGRPGEHRGQTDHPTAARGVQAWLLPTFPQGPRDS